jgi:hypothetical protein
MKVVIQQADMDTCLTALLLGVSQEDEVVVVREDAAPVDLQDPTVLCIEAGGSGQVERQNFDHHNTTCLLPPACQQALQVTGCNDPVLVRLVEYVTALEVSGPRVLPVLPAPGFPTLSQIFSGMRLVVQEPAAQLMAGLAIFTTVLTQGLDPFGLMPCLPAWQSFLAAKRQNTTAITQAKMQAEIFVSKRGLTVGFLETTAIGALGALYALGCAVAIGYTPRFGPASLPKYTIGGNGMQMLHLLPLLNALEPGWGGPAHGTIIASPRTGSRLTPAVVKCMVRKNL